jgi:hypothetical protein
MQIDFSDEQLAKANSSVSEIFESLSNVTPERLEQFLKQDFETISTEEGRQIDSSDEQSAKADSPRLLNLPRLSNLTLASRQH